MDSKLFWLLYFIFISFIKHFEYLFIYRILATNIINSKLQIYK